MISIGQEYMPLKEMVQNDNTSLKLVVLIYHHDSLKMINQLPGSLQQV